MRAAHEHEFDRFYGQREPQVMRFLIGMLGDPSLAADAASRTWLRYLRYAERPTPRLDVALLMAVARNAVRETIRCHPGGLDHGQWPGEWDPGDAIALALCVTRLPTVERAVVLMHYALGLRREETLRALGLSEAALQAHLGAAIGRLCAECSTPARRQGHAEDRLERALRGLGPAYDRLIEGGPALTAHRPFLHRLGGRRRLGRRLLLATALGAAIAFTILAAR